MDITLMSREPIVYCLHIFFVHYCAIFLGEITFVGRWRVWKVDVPEANAHNSWNQIRARIDKRISSCYLSKHCKRYQTCIRSDIYCLVSSFLPFISFPLFFPFSLSLCFCCLFKVLILFALL